MKLLQKTTQTNALSATRWVWKVVQKLLNGGLRVFKSNLSLLASIWSVIHGQNAHYQLLKPDNQVSWFGYFCRAQAAHGDVIVRFDILKQKQQLLETVSFSTKTTKRPQNLLRSTKFQELDE